MDNLPNHRAPVNSWPNNHRNATGDNHPKPAQAQLRLWVHLAVQYPSWLSDRSPEHKSMMVRMLMRVTLEEASE